MYSPLTIVLNEKENLESPSPLMQLMEDLKQYLKDHPYSEKKPKEQCRKIDQGIKFLLLHPRLQKALSGSNNSDSTQWIEEWKNGDTLYIDLTHANQECHQLLSRRFVILFVK